VGLDEVSTGGGFARWGDMFVGGLCWLGFLVFLYELNPVNTPEEENNTPS